MSIRAVLDTSVLVPVTLRSELQQQAQLEQFTGLWSPWIIAELTRVLTWRWLSHPPLGGQVGNLSRANQRRCSEASKRLMEWLLPSFELVHPLPPYPPAWASLRDQWDHPIWAAAKMGDAHYVVSENTRDFPPLGADGRHVYEGIEYVRGRAFLALLADGLE